MNRPGLMTVFQTLIQHQGVAIENLLMNQSSGRLEEAFSFIAKVIEDPKRQNALPRKKARISVDYLEDGF